MSSRPHPPDPILALPALSAATRRERTLILANIDTLLLPANWSLPPTAATDAQVLLVVRGEVETPTEPRRLHGPGALLGAAAMLNRTPQTALARTTQPSRIGCIGRAQMQALMTGSAAFATAVAVALAQEALARDRARGIRPRPRLRSPSSS
jgi:CRP-like cAMP-binding protein